MLVLIRNVLQSIFFKKRSRNSLVVEWLRLGAFTAEGPGFNPWSGN